MNVKLKKNYKKKKQIKDCLFNSLFKKYCINEPYNAIPLPSEICTSENNACCNRKNAVLHSGRHRIYNTVLANIIKNCYGSSELKCLIRKREIIRLTLGNLGSVLRLYNSETALHYVKSTDINSLKRKIGNKFSRLRKINKKITEEIFNFTEAILQELSRNSKQKANKSNGSNKNE